MIILISFFIICYQLYIFFHKKLFILMVNINKTNKCQLAVYHFHNEKNQFIL
nr:hypothetical protein [Megavirus caiporensis]